MIIHKDWTLCRIWTAAVADVYITIILSWALGKKKTGLKQWHSPLWAHHSTYAMYVQLRKDHQQAHNIHCLSWVSLEVRVSLKVYRVSYSSEHTVTEPQHCTNWSVRIGLSLPVSLNGLCPQLTWCQFLGSIKGSELYWTIFQTASGKGEFS